MITPRRLNLSDNPRILSQLGNRFHDLVEALVAACGGKSCADIALSDRTPFLLRFPS
jgi:hypothetical protein